MRANADLLPIHCDADDNEWAQPQQYDADASKETVTAHDTTSTPKLKFDLPKQNRDRLKNRPQSGTRRLAKPKVLSSEH